MPKTCFVVGPIGDAGTPIRGHADWLLDQIIAPVFAEHFKEFEVIRSDKIALPGMIDSQVINHLLDADLVIADLTFQNPNVFYEMGIRHMAVKPIIHMFRAGEVIPFDVKLYRAIQFSLEHPKHLSEAREQLKQAVDAVLASGQVVNPVTHARGYAAALSQQATPGMDVILMEIESLKTRVHMAETAAAVAQDSAMRAMGSPPYTNYAGTLVRFLDPSPSALAALRPIPRQERTLIRPYLGLNFQSIRPRLLLSRENRTVSLAQWIVRRKSPLVKCAQPAFPGS
jgi:hypothetical protein